MDISVSSSFRATGLIIFGIIILLNLLVGVWAGRNVKDTDDFFVGGRHMGKLLITCTQLATWIGGAMTMAWVSYGYQQGFAAFWYCALQGIGPLVAAFFLVKTFRAKKFTSLPDYFADVYQNKVVTAIVTVVVMVIPITWTASQFSASARMMSGVLGIDFTVGVIITAAVVMGYSVFGGFTSVVYTDTLQFMILFVLFLIIAPQPVIMAGGVGATISALPEDMSNLFQLKDLSSYAMLAYVIYGITEFLSNQTSYQRIYAADSEKTARFSLIVTGILTFIWGIGAPITGMAIRSLNPNLIPDEALSWFLSSHASDVLCLAFLACIMMATMSTADSCLNSLSVNISHDIYQNLINPKADDKKVLRAGRIVSLLFGFVSMYWALQGGSIVNFFNYSAGLSAGPIAAIILFTRFANKEIRTPYAVGSGMVVGVLAGLAATQISSLTSIIGGGLLLSFPGTIIVAVIVGMATKGKVPKAAAG